VLQQTFRGLGGEEEGERFRASRDGHPPERSRPQPTRVATTVGSPRP
jgi:hypothetical protein